MTKRDEIVKEVAAANTAAMFQNLALIGALAERHFVDPAKVAWAEFFAKRMENSAANGSANPEHVGKVARPRDYAGQLVNITKPSEKAECLRRILQCHFNYFDQQLQNANKWFASTKGIIAKSVRMFSVGRAATHTSWFINLAVEVPSACRPAASGGGLTFGKC